jgi:electron transport complex protein RnfD
MTMATTRLFKVSPSPHVHQPQDVKQIMYGVILALLPALAVSVYVFGLPALLLTILSVLFCVITEYLIARFWLGQPSRILDGSAVITGILLAFNVPANLPWYILLAGSIVAIGIGKLTFGGLGKNPFNPALVGRVFLLISFPVQMTHWPAAQPDSWWPTDGQSGATVLGLVKEGLHEGKPLGEIAAEIPGYWSLFLGGHGGSLGEISAAALLLGLGFLFYKRIVTWHIPVSMLGSMAVFAGITWAIDPTTYLSPMFHLLTGGAILGAVFMATDYTTSPMTHRGMILFGIGIGCITMVIRLFGAYPEGVSFAILIMNAFVPLINKYVKPRRFGTPTTFR